MCVSSVAQYLMEFNGTYGDLMELSPLFSDDSRVAEASAIAQKLRKCGWWKVLPVHVCEDLSVVSYFLENALF